MRPWGTYILVGMLIPGRSELLAGGLESHWVLPNEIMGLLTTPANISTDATRNVVVLLPCRAPGLTAGLLVTK